MTLSHGPTGFPAHLLHAVPYHPCERLGPPRVDTRRETALKVLLQWTLATPGDWVELNIRANGQASRAWRNLPKKPVPTGSDTIDDTPGWLFSANIQGVDLFGFDHVAAEPITNGVRVYGWNDDPEDHLYPWGEVWEFRDGWVDRSITMPDGMVMRHQGPDQRKTVYSSDPEQAVPVECGGLPVELRPWSEFPTPAAAITLHGVWVQDDALFRQHFDARRKVGWRDWVA